MCRAGPYADIDELDAREAKALFARCLQRHGGTNAGATLVMVSETNGVMEGFIIGALDRIYHIGTKLMATDIYFIMLPRADPRDSLKLFKAFEAWAWNNPKVIEIKLGTTFEYGKRPVDKIYVRNGYAVTGNLYVKRKAT
jgi:hypothetical protein